ncbi:MAG: hypothetical protein R2882_12715 [Gemmatimonadales bacterium]
MVPLPERAVDARQAESADDEGVVLDTASPALFRARREIHPPASAWSRSSRRCLP